ncbi:hypothetical protein PENTCL1PPCAC_18904 [Pristionchus entomophagus]|uniref:NR LBD domain-containing protein n=1 Tax=Pristionchus entomophagus TaxID=358040 RepID=A0AAV5TRZ0_9BILA|nr:hypothetical protein PENTCL1PPCAC_18904 [Pristionchus entomophagus]
MKHSSDYDSLPSILTLSLSVMSLSYSTGHPSLDSTMKISPLAQHIIPDMETMKKFLKLLYHKKFCGAPGSVKHWTSTGIMCAMEMMKTLPKVEGMPSDSRRRLLLSSSMACAHFTDSFFSFQQSSPFTIYPDGTMPYAADPPYALATEFHIAVIERMRKIGMDQVEFMLARAILCFSTSFDDPSFDENREFYTRILCSYTIATRGTRIGPSAVLDIFSLISFVLSLTQKLKGFQLFLGITRRPAMRSSLMEAVLSS